MSRRILYLQYTNPAGYPPLLHSAGMLAEAGWQVLFVGRPAEGAASLVLPAHEAIRYLQVDGAMAAHGVTRYAHFATRALLAGARFRPDWCYASDALSTPVALMMRGVWRPRLLYHEHDAPPPAALRPRIRKARARLATRADIVIAPSAERLALVPKGRGRRYVVWNCPRRSEVATGAAAPSGQHFRLVYHGSLSRDRLTPQFIDALRMLPAEVALEIYGYETAGHRGYAAELLQRAQAAGVGERVRYHGPVPARAELLARLRGHQLGIATIVAGADHNLDTLAGASNKAFEYLALGIPLLISRDAAWQRLYQDPGYAVDCVPTDAASIAAAVRGLLADPGRARSMGEQGRARIAAEWNYETQFAPVLEQLSA